ncbi:hypothetical protein [Anaerostipes sp. PC18]|uniref:hypothetical protein n=1 Tax=Anaerostipes sp. PC18 TaxID=3036926 RepID=UPI0030926C56|nr:hypothetical protein P8F77_10305 [Anaerostipes sp. PC18]
MKSLESKGEKLLNIKRRFTKWYIKRGYSFGYEFGISEGICNARYYCPFWVKPFLILFSPSVYMKEKFRQGLVSGFIKGISQQGVE